MEEIGRCSVRKFIPRIAGWNGSCKGDPCDRPFVEGGQQESKTRRREMSERRKTRTRTREPEPIETNYDQVVRAKEIRNKRMAEGKVIVNGKDLPWELNRQGRIKYFLTDKSEDAAAPGWLVFQQEIKKHSGMLRHQGGTFIFVLGGEGYSIVKEVRYDWEAGELTMLPMMPGGVVH